MGLSFPGTGMQADKLWENSNPAVAFAAQKVSLDLSVYDGVFVLCALKKNYSQRKSEFVFVGTMVTMEVWSYSDQMPGGLRRIQVDPDGVTFSEGYYYQWDTQKYIVDNEGAVPIAIYGVKF